MMGGARKNILFMVVGVGLLILVGLPAVLLYQGISRFSDAERDLRRSVNSLRQYYQRNPFPSPENVERGNENIRLLDECFDDLMARLGRGQQEIADKSPTSFMGLLSDTENRLFGFATRSGTEVSDSFAFGFERYEGGVPPSPNDVPKLTRQLAVVETVCRVFFAAGVDEIAGIRREQFEAGAEGAAPGGGRPGLGQRPPMLRRPGAPPPSGPAAVRETAASRAAAASEEGVEGVLHFTFDVKCKEQALRKALNLLARLKMFVVVSSVELGVEGPDTGVRLSPGASAVVGEPGGGVAAGESGHLPPRRDRTVCGPDMESPMGVKVSIEVYRFRRPTGTEQE